ncbi:MAG: hypothetical protein IJX61_02795 [Ruminococcus sp.]|nr:hypothetical protein [Ruminococcus sp.]
MNEKINKLKKSANNSACGFFIIAVFLGFLVVTTVATIVWKMLRGSFDMIEIPKYLGTTIAFLFTAISSLIMAKGLSEVSKKGKPFDAKNVRTFKLSGKFMMFAGMAGSLICVISSRFLSETEAVDFEGVGFGLIICGLIIQIFVDFLYYAVGVQDELDTIA